MKGKDITKEYKSLLTKEKSFKKKCISEIELIALKNLKGDKRNTLVHSTVSGYTTRFFQIFIDWDDQNKIRLANYNSGYFPLDKFDAHYLYCIYTALLEKKFVVGELDNNTYQHLYG